MFIGIIYSGKKIHIRNECVVKFIFDEIRQDSNYGGPRRLS